MTINKGDPLYFNFVGGLDAHGFEGWYRSLDAGKEFECRKVHTDEDGTIKGWLLEAAEDCCTLHGMGWWQSV